MQRPHGPSRASKGPSMKGSSGRSWPAGDVCWRKREATETFEPHSLQIRVVQRRCPRHSSDVAGPKCQRATLKVTGSVWVPGPKVQDQGIAFSRIVAIQATQGPAPRILRAHRPDLGRWALGLPGTAATPAARPRPPGSGRSGHSAASAQPWRLGNRPRNRLPRLMRHVPPETSRIGWRG